MFGKKSVTIKILYISKMETNEIES